MQKTYRDSDDGNIIKGIGLPAFIHNGDYFLVTIHIYEDGWIDCWGKVDFDEFIQKVQSGWVVTTVPSGERISLHHSFYGTSDSITTYIKEEEFIKEVRDTLDELQGNSTSSQRCREAFNQFLKTPSQSNQLILRDTYLTVPEHLRRYVLGDMDMKDGPICYIIEEKPFDNDKLEWWRKRYEHID